MYYIFVENGKLNGAGQCKCLSCENIETTQDIYEDYIKTPNKYTWEEKEVEVPVYETKENEVKSYDDEGNLIDTHIETEQIITGYKNETIKVIILNPDYEKEQRLIQINIELTQADTLYTTQLDTPVSIEVKENITHLYKPKWAEETYISLLSAGQLMPSMFPMLIWDATELQENAVEMTLAELTQLTAKLAAIQQQYFDERKIKKSALIKEKEELEN